MSKPSMIIGQAQGQTWKNNPFPRSKLWAWFGTIGWEADAVVKQFHFDALINTGTKRAKKGRVPPKPDQIKLYRPQLLATIDKMKPKLIVAVGGLAVKHILDNHRVELADVVGKRIVAKPFGTAKRETVIIPLPHPSGVSLWMNAAGHRKLQHKAMQLIKAEIVDYATPKLGRITKA